MIDDGLGFQLVPWRPALEQQLGRQVSGVMTPGGGVDWSFRAQARAWSIVNLTVPLFSYNGKAHYPRASKR